MLAPAFTHGEYGLSTDTALSVGILIVSVAILIVAAITLWFTVPRRAKLVVDRFEELETEDLIFSVHPQPNPDGVPQVPREYILQLAVAVANIGGRKAILSSISIINFLTKAGERVFLPESVQGPIFGMQWELKMGWTGAGNRVFENIASTGPYVLAADDAIVIRFRSRRGIDWSQRWDLVALKGYYEQIVSPFVSARVRIVWRRAREVVREEFDIPLRVLQHDLYVSAIKEQTVDLTVRPDIKEEAIGPD
jgi:hypothetical protein